MRFFARARCPKCRAPVDPTYRLRIARAAVNLGRPASGARVDRAVWGAALAASAGAVLTAVIFLAAADRWWPATVLLFGPRWTLLLPFVLLVTVAAWRDRLLLVPLTVGVLVLVGPVLGFRTGIRALFTRAGDADLRVVSFNAEGGSTLTLGAAELLQRWDADLVMIQECGRPLRQALRAVDGWQHDGASSLCIASRFPILDEAVMQRENIRSVGGSGLVATYTLDVHGTTVHATDVHLETPRAGLELIRGGEVLEGGEILRQKSILREIELRRAERWAREAGTPGIVLGDFNTPPESHHLRSIWGGWTNAFSVAGLGIGGTRLNGWIRARIDHVMVDDAWTVVDAWVGEDVGSDHLPMLARIRLRQ